MIWHITSGLWAGGLSITTMSPGGSDGSRHGRTCVVLLAASSSCSFRRWRAAPQFTDRFEISGRFSVAGHDDDIKRRTRACHHGSILTSTMLSVPGPCSQVRTGSPTRARPRLAQAATRRPVAPPVPLLLALPILGGLQLSVCPSLKFSRIATGWTVPARRVRLDRCPASRDC
jgi:hypothetical protein